MGRIRYSAGVESTHVVKEIQKIIHSNGRSVVKVSRAKFIVMLYEDKNESLMYFQGVKIC